MSRRDSYLPRRTPSRRYSALPPREVSPTSVRRPVQPSHTARWVAEQQRYVPSVRDSSLPRYYDSSRSIAGSTSDSETVASYDWPEVIPSRNPFAMDYELYLEDYPMPFRYSSSGESHGRGDAPLRRATESQAQRRRSRAPSPPSSPSRYSQDHGFHPNDGLFRRERSHGPGSRCASSRAGSYRQDIHGVQPPLPDRLRPNPFASQRRGADSALPPRPAPSRPTRNRSATFARPQFYRDSTGPHRVSDVNEVPPRSYSTGRGAWALQRNLSRD